MTQLKKAVAVLAVALVAVLGVVTVDATLGAASATKITPCC